MARIDGNKAPPAVATQKTAAVRPVGSDPAKVAEQSAKLAKVVVDTKSDFAEANTNHSLLGRMADEVRRIGQETGPTFYATPLLKVMSTIGFAPLIGAGAALKGAAALEKKLRPGQTDQVSAKELDQVAADFRGGAPLEQAVMLPVLSEWRNNLDAKGSLSDDARQLLDGLIRRGEELPGSLRAQGARLSGFIGEVLALYQASAGEHLNHALRPLLQHFKALPAADQALTRPLLHQAVFAEQGLSSQLYNFKADDPAAAELKRLVAPAAEDVVAWDAAFR